MTRGLLITGFALSTTLGGAEIRFVDLGMVRGVVRTNPVDVLPDGSAVFGYYYDPELTHFQWTEKSGMTPLEVRGDLVVVGDGGHVLVSNDNEHAWRRRQDGWWQALFREYFSLRARVVALSSDGRFSVGNYRQDYFQRPPLWWDQDCNWHYLPFGSYYHASARSISPNGDFVCGSLYSHYYNDPSAVVWTRESGEFRTLTRPNGITRQRAYLVSNDGQVVIGVSGSYYEEPCIWKGSRLAMLPQRVRYLSCMSDDGGVAAGGLWKYDVPSTNIAAIWTSSTGLLSLEDYVRYKSPSFDTQLRLNDVKAISDNGRCIVGAVTTTGSPYSNRTFLLEMDRPVATVSLGTANITTGRQVSGSYRDLQDADDTNWVLQPREHGNDVGQVEVVFETRLPRDSRGGFQLHVSGTAVNNPRVAVQFYDFVSRGWITTEVTGLDDVKRPIEVNNLPNRFQFVQVGSNRVRARLVITPWSGGTDYEVALDQVKWMAIE